MRGSEIADDSWWIKYRIAIPSNVAAVVDNHARIFKTMALAHLNIGGNQITDATLNAIYKQPEVRGIEDLVHIDLPTVITSADCEFTRNLYAKSIVPKEFAFYKFETDEKTGSRKVTLNDFVRDVSFIVHQTSVDGACFFSSVNYDKNGIAKFLEFKSKLQQLNDDERADVLRFMAGRFKGKLLAPEEKDLREDLCRRVAGFADFLERVRKHQEDYMKGRLERPRAITWPEKERRFREEESQLNEELIRLLNQRDTFNVVLEKDLNPGQPYPLGGCTTYSNLYGRINKINIATITSFTEITKGKFKYRTIRIANSCFFPGRPYVFTFMNYGHFSALIPINLPPTLYQPRLNQLEPDNGTHFMKYHNVIVPY